MLLNPTSGESCRSFQFVVSSASILLSAVQCNSLTRLKNGKITYSTEPSNNIFSWNEQATFSCDEGFTLEGEKNRTCSYPKTDGGLGEWSNGTNQTCVG